MTTIELYKALKTLFIPVAHEVFLTHQKTPYIIYRANDYGCTAANGKTVCTRKHITVEVYTELAKTAETEEKVEKLLDSFTTYAKSGSYISDQKIYVTYYKFDIIGG